MQIIKGRETISHMMLNKVAIILNSNITSWQFMAS